MIMAICTISVCLIIFLIFKIYQKDKALKASEQKLYEECSQTSELRNELHHSKEREMILTEDNSLKASLLHELSQKLEQKDSEEMQEQGNYVRTRSFKPATPETYQAVFDYDTAGQRVLAHLQSRFMREGYVRDKDGGERESCFRLGQRNVINFIISQINAEPEVEENDD